jgi:hypothetical protein
MSGGSYVAETFAMTIIESCLKRFSLSLFGNTPAIRDDGCDSMLLR